MVKNLFGSLELRYPRLRKNTAHLQSMFAMANPYRALMRPLAKWQQRNKKVAESEQQPSTGCKTYFNADMFVLHE